MSIRIGQVDLIGVQDIYTEENRNLVEQRVPDQQGSVFQDLGREPITLVLEGLLFGSEVINDLEKLRQAQEKLEPLPMAADIAVGSELTDVIIEDFKIRQVAGYASRYRFCLKLREHKEAPQSQAKDDAPVNDAVASDAKSWSEDSMAASAALEDPSSISDSLTKNPDLLNHMSAGDLAGSIADNAAGLSADDFGGALSAVGSLDPGKMGDMLEGIQKKGVLGGFMEKFAAAGRSLAKMLKGVDLIGLVKGMVALFTAGAEIIKLLGELWKDMKTAWDSLKKMDLLSGLEALLNTAVDQLGKLIGAIAKLVSTLNKIVEALKPKEEGGPSLIDSLRDMKCAPTVLKILTPVIETLKKMEDFLVWAGAQIIQLAGVSALLGLMRPVIAGGFQIIDSIGNQMTSMGIMDNDDVEDVKSSSQSTGSGVKSILESGKVGLDKLLSFGESLLSTDLDIQTSALGKAFGELRVNLTFFKTELERPVAEKRQLPQGSTQPKSLF